MENLQSTKIKGKLKSPIILTFRNNSVNILGVLPYIYLFLPVNENIFPNLHQVAYLVFCHALNTSSRR